jgi:predicted RNase H-like nuclease
MTSVLGIDAAWTDRHPSGVALVEKGPDGWRCVRVAPSYEAFVTPGNVDWAHDAPSPTSLDRTKVVVELLDSIEGGRPTVVAVDMPLALDPIIGRRAADNEISKKFGAAGCGTHSPSRKKPGSIGKNLRAGLEAAGYRLATTATKAGTRGQIVEVYPHTGILDLLGISFRARYKVTKTKRYWPDESIKERRKLLLESQHQILDALAADIEGIDMPLPRPDEPGTLVSLESFEDGLDALVCAWTGIQYLEDKATAYGDDTAAIWVPTS